MHSIKNWGWYENKRKIISNKRTGKSNNGFSNNFTYIVLIK